MNRLVSGFLIIIFLTSTFVCALNMRSVRADGTIYIRADGSIDPPTTSIHGDDNVTYTLVENIASNIVVEKSCITIEGPGHELEGTVTLTDVANVTVRNMTNYGGFLMNNTQNSEICFNTIGSHAGDFGICVLSSSNNRIFGNSVHSYDDVGGSGIALDHSLNNSIFENSISEEYDGMVIGNSQGNVIAKNNIWAGKGTAVSFASSSNNTFCGNIVEAGWGSLLRLSSASYNIIAENSLDGSYEEIGIVILLSLNNLFYHNNFWFYSGLSVDSSPNTWDDGYPSGGNYWAIDEELPPPLDLYKGPFQNETGSDGIRDIPLLLAPNNRDNCPLMNPYYEHDIAVNNVYPSKSIVACGSSTSVNVTVENLGHSLTGFSLTLNCSYVYSPLTRINTLFATDQGWNNSIPGPAITAIEGDTITLTLVGVDNLHHKFYVDYNGNSFPDPSEPQSADFINTTVALQFKADTVGDFIYYCAYYQDTLSGPFEVQAAPNGTARVGAQNVTLAPNEMRTVTFTWNTSGFAYGNYILSAYAWPVLGETDTANNNFSGGVVTVTILGDINGDGTVDIYDAILLSNAFSTYPDHPNWKPNADINGDNIVDIYDAVLLSNHYNQHCP